MEYVLNNNEIQIAVNTIGGELVSVKAVDTNIEYLWTGDKVYWDYHAPTLFPIIGGSINGHYTYNGTSYPMPPHGFIRDYEFTLVESTETTLVLGYESKDETKAIYPFDFKFYTTFTLDGASVSVTHRVENTSAETMYFFLGDHPGFLFDNDINDYIIEFKHPENPMSYQPITLPNGEGRTSSTLLPVPFEDDMKTLRVSVELFEKAGVYIFHNTNSNAVTIRNTKTNHSVTVDYNGYPYLGIWARPSAPFVCIEPWCGISNMEGYDACALNEKPGVNALKSNDSFSCTHIIKIN